MATKKYDNEKVFTLRLSQDTFNKVKEKAEKDKRSISKEIEFILDAFINSAYKFDN